MGRNLKGGLGAARLVVGLAAVGLVCVSYGQVEEEWVEIFPNDRNGGSGARAVGVDPSGNVYVIGRTNLAFTTVKYDPTGSVLWERILSDAITPSKLAVDDAGNVFVTGTANALTTTGPQRIATVKYDTDGNEIWAARVLGPDRRVFLADIAVDGAGSVYLACTTGDVFTAGFDLFTLKLDPAGVLAWSRRYDGPASNWDFATSLAVDGAGNTYVTGSAKTDGTRRNDILLLKYAPNGDLLWERRYDGAGASGQPEAAHSVVLDENGTVFLAGYAVTAETHLDYVVLKYDPAGNLLWMGSYDGPAHSADYAYAMELDSTGALLVTGQSFGLNSWYDYATVKFDASGNLLWVRRYDGPELESSSTVRDVAYLLAVDSGDNVYVSGRAAWHDDVSEFATLKCDPDGNLLWIMEYTGLDDSEGARPSAIALGSDNSVYLAGRAKDSVTGFVHFATVKYAQTAVTLPGSFSVVRGVLTDGGLGDLFASDDVRLEVRAGLTLFLGESPLQVVVTGTSPVEVPGELRFKLEASANTPGLTQMIELYNYVTSSWEEVDLSVPGAMDGIVEVVITTDPGRFVQAGTREMRAKVVYRQVGFTLLWPWSAMLDQTVWTIVP